jgi:NAD(P)-dependent dehydrogenase (short-subunit alcohol dehydrogenase family)
MSLACVLITGASSGIGRALALALAAPDAVLHLGGRDTARLAAVAEACRARGATAEARGVDVRDSVAMAAWIAGAGPLDVVIANAGISGGTGPGPGESPAQTRAIFAVNLDGVLNTVLPATELMLRHPPDATGVRGRIAVVASIGAFLPAPGAPAYCASKAAVDRWTLAMAPSLRPHGVLLTSVCPGFIRTPMTEGNTFAMPGLMDAERAARLMLRGIAAGRMRVVFPWWLAATSRLIAALPPRLGAALLARGPQKAPLELS